MPNLQTEAYLSLHIDQPLLLLCAGGAGVSGQPPPCQFSLSGGLEAHLRDIHTRLPDLQWGRLGHCMWCGLGVWFWGFCHPGTWLWLWLWFCRSLLLWLFLGSWLNGLFEVGLRPLQLLGQLCRLIGQLLRTDLLIGQFLCLEAQGHFSWGLVNNTGDTTSVLKLFIPQTSVRELIWVFPSVFSKVRFWISCSRSWSLEFSSFKWVSSWQARLYRRIERECESGRQRDRERVEEKRTEKETK